jgi:hypothetical protein
MSEDHAPMRIYPGVNGRRVAIDLAKVEAVLEEDDETHIFTSSDWYRVRAPFDQVLADWRGR